MHEYDVQTTLQDLSRTFEEFKSMNNERLRAIENKKHIDPLDEEKMARLEEGLENAEKRLNKMEAFAFRPSVGTMEAPFCAHTDAFMGYIRKGLDAPLHVYESKALSTTPDPDGGYLVPPQLHQHLYATLQSTSVMRSLASRREISSSVLELLIDKETADAGWVTEKQDRVETQEPHLAKLRIPVHEMYAKPMATQKLLDDSLLNVEEWLSQKVSQKMAFMENSAFINGDGTNKPKGILSYETVEKNTWEWGKLEEITTGVRGSFAEGRGAETLQDAFFALKPQYSLTHIK